MSKQNDREDKFLPYGRQHIWPSDTEAVLKVLSSDWLTQGPRVPAFEEALAEVLRARHVVACANGTAALHLAMLALNVGPGDVVVTTPITFLSSANCARFVGARVRFVDIEPDTALMDVAALAEVLGRDTEHKIRAVVPVHFAGQPAALPDIFRITREHETYLVDDACHALGATYMHENRPSHIGSGSHSDLTVYSFHPVKHIAMGEGGAVASSDKTWADRMRLHRTHDIHKDGFLNNDMAHDRDGRVNPWYYEMHELGYNYRLTDFQAALGLSQMERLDWSLKRRKEIAALYDRLLAERFDPDDIRPLTLKANSNHAWHLFVVLIEFEKFNVTRAQVMNHLREKGIGTQVHYIPIHLQPYYRRHCGTKPGDFPNSEHYYERALSLPMFPDLSDDDINRVVESLAEFLKK